MNICEEWKQSEVRAIFWKKQQVEHNKTSKVSTMIKQICKEYENVIHINNIIQQFALYKTKINTEKNQEKCLKYVD